MLRILASAVGSMLEKFTRLVASLGRVVRAARRARTRRVNQNVGRRRPVDDDADDERARDALDPLGGATARRAPSGSGLASVRSSRAVRVRFVNW